MTMLSEAPDTVEVNPNPTALADNTEGVLYLLDEDHAFYEEPLETFARSASELAPDRLDFLREEVAAGRKPMTWFTNVYDTEGKEIDRFSVDYEPFFAALKDAGHSEFEFRGEANSVVRLGNLFIVSRGTTYVQSIEEIDGVERFRFGSFAYEGRQRELAEREFTSAHGDALAARCPSWASTGPEVTAEHDGSGSADWHLEVIKEEFFLAQISRYDRYDAGQWRTHSLEFSIGIDRNDTIDFISTDLLREAANKMLAVADKFDALLAGE